MKPTRLLQTVITATLLSTSYLTNASGLLEVYKVALESDPVLKQSLSNQRSVAEGKKQAYAAFLPQISASASTTGLRSTGLSTGRSDYNNHGFGLNARQSVYDKSNYVNNRIANTNTLSADADFEAARQDLMARVTNAYFDVLLAADTVEFSKAEQKAIARQLEQAKRRYEVGIIAITAVLNAQAGYDSATAAVLQAKNNFQISRERLRDIAGKYFDSLAPVADKIPLEPPKPNNIDTWVKLALENNPALASINYQGLSSKQRISLESSGHYPTLDLVATYSNVNKNGPGSGGSRDGYDGTVGLELAVPIYQGGFVSSRVRQAQYNFQATQDKKEELRRTTERQTRSSFLSVLSEISRVKALNQAVISNDSSLKATEAGFEVGTRTIVDVLNVQRDRFEAKKNYSEARYNFILGKIFLKQSTGTLKESDLEMVDKWLKK